MVVESETASTGLRNLAATEAQMQPECSRASIRGSGWLALYFPSDVLHARFVYQQQTKIWQSEQRK